MMDPDDYYTDRRSDSLPKMTRMERIVGLVLIGIAFLSVGWLIGRGIWVLM